MLLSSIHIYIMAWDLTRSSALQVHVLDLSVTLKLEYPFGELEASRKATCSAVADDQALRKAIKAGKAVAGK